jgi:hypothetical protein
MEQLWLYSQATCQCALDRKKGGWPLLVDSANVSSDSAGSLGTMRPNASAMAIHGYLRLRAGGVRHHGLPRRFAPRSDGVSVRRSVGVGGKRSDGKRLVSGDRQTILRRPVQPWGLRGAASPTG